MGSLTTIPFLSRPQALGNLLSRVALASANFCKALEKEFEMETSILSMAEDECSRDSKSSAWAMRIMKAYWKAQETVSTLLAKGGRSAPRLPHVKNIISDGRPIPPSLCSGITGFPETEEIAHIRISAELLQKDLTDLETTSKAVISVKEKLWRRWCKSKEEVIPELSSALHCEARRTALVTIVREALVQFLSAREEIEEVDQERRRGNESQCLNAGEIQEANRAISFASAAQYHRKEVLSALTDLPRVSAERAHSLKGLIAKGTYTADLQLQAEQLIAASSAVATASQGLVNVWKPVLELLLAFGEEELESAVEFLQVIAPEGTLSDSSLLDQHRQREEVKNSKAIFWSAQTASEAKATNNTRASSSGGVTFSCAQPLYSNPSPATRVLSRSPWSMLEVEVNEDIHVAFRQGVTSTSRERHLMRRHEQERAQLLNRITEVDKIALGTSSRCKDLMKDIRDLATEKMKRLLALKATQTTVRQLRQELATAQGQLAKLRESGQNVSHENAISNKKAKPLNPFAADLHVSESDL